MKILFLCLSPLKFDVNTPYDRPLGGTESALAYLSVQLVKCGHEVTLMRNAPEEGKLQGVQHLAISEDIAQLNPDVVIITSAPQACPAVKKLVPRAQIILWCHMRPDQPAMLHLFQDETQKSIDHVVYVSESQKKAFASASKNVGAMNSTVIGNAIAPTFENMFSSAQEIFEDKECRGAYTSTPFRGLAVLSFIKELPIEVYSSMQVYQGDDAPFTAMYAKLKENDCIYLKGSVSQRQLRENLRKVSFLIYPSIFAECHSIAILEAMAAGLKVVTTEIAHPQTDYVDSTAGSLEDYGALLRKNINAYRAHPQDWALKMFEQVRYINREFTWAKRAIDWDIYLRSLCKMPETA